jgi:hypothetical protein
LFSKTPLSLSLQLVVVVYYPVSSFFVSSSSLFLSDDEIPIKAAQKQYYEKEELRKTNYTGLLCPDAVFDDLIRSHSRNSNTTTVSEKI